jgi:outer membrane protein insertion porin family
VLGVLRVPVVLWVLVPGVVWVLGVLGCPSAFAQQAPPAAPFVGKPVVWVAVSVEGRPSTDPVLLEAVQTKIGRPLDMADVRETMTHLYTLGRFDDVQVEANEAAGGVAITIQLEPIHVVTKVEFRGELALPEGELRDRMAERFGSTPTLGRAADVAEVLSQLYAERGYLQAKVAPGAPILQHEPERATVVFDVTAGPRVKIARTQITGNPLEPAARVEERLRIAPEGPYQPGDLRTRLNDYVTWMRHRGHYEATARDQARLNADRTEVELTVDVQPGPVVSVQFTGDPLPADKRADLVPVEREGSVDQDILEDAAHAITDYLQQQGYWKANVAPPTRKEADGQVAIVFNVQRGPLFRVAPGGVKVSGAAQLPAEDLRLFLKTLPEGDPFVASKMSAIEGAIKQAYLRRGYATVQVESQPNQAGPNLVAPAIVVKEGPPVLIGTIGVKDNEKVPAAQLLDSLGTIGLRTGAPYYGPTVAAARDEILNRYLDRGFQSADVIALPPVAVASGATARADVVFQVTEGPQTMVEHIFITGNVRTKQAVIERELRIRPDAPLGQQDLTDTRQNLARLGLFRRIQISAVSHGDPTRSDVIVTVEESQQTTLDYGGGLQVERILRDSDTPFQRYEFAPRGFFEIGRRNVGGKNRSINLYTRVGVRPSADTAESNPFGFPEYRVVGTYREPRVLQGFADATGTAAIEQGVRTGFNFVRKGMNAELTHQVSPRVRTSGQYAFTTTRIFDEQLSEEDKLTVDRVFSQVRLSMFSGAVSRDSRDDLLAPQRGTLLSADATVAPRPLGSEIGFVKLFLQGFLYRQFGRPNQVFAAGARVGMARTQKQIKNGVEIEDLPASERFFAGGDTTVRGFARDSLGRPETLTPTGFPRGGDAEIILNAELRLPVKGGFGAVVFADSGNVFAKAADFELAKLRAALGFGGRYVSPFGPIRIDFGFPVHRYVIGNELEKRFQIHFSMGHAF